MKLRKYFPLGKAYGDAFCNRETETAWLAGNMLNAKHSLLIAPRRYGKSSLAERSIEQAKLPFVTVNFHLCTTEREVAQLISNSVTKLIGLTLGRVEKLVTSIKKYVSTLNPKLSLGGKVMTLEFTSSEDVNQAVVISESLLILDKLLREKKKKAVLFFDEFQEISKINKSTHLEGAIRTAAQEMQNLAIIFSGSVRSLLLSMFEDENKPLYKLCRKLKLERISAEDYKKHINKISRKTWQRDLDEAVFSEIIALTHRHPYYINYLCDTLWQTTSKYPTVSEVTSAWKIVIEEEWSDALKEISVLSLAQRKILKYVALHSQMKNITSQETCKELGMPASTINSAVDSLVERDYIEVEEGYYKVINPLLLAVLLDN